MSVASFFHIFSVSIWVSFDFQNAFSPQLPRFFGFTRAPEELSSARNDPWVQHLECLVGQKMEMRCNRSMATWSWKSHHLLVDSCWFGNFRVWKSYCCWAPSMLSLSCFQCKPPGQEWICASILLWCLCYLCYMLVCEEGCKGRQVQGMLRSRSPFLKPF